MLDYIRKLQDNIYLAEIPLKGNPLKAINIYIIKTDDKNMIIDTGFNTEEILDYTKAFIKDLDLDLDKTELFLTHLHSDHTGLANFYDDLGVKIRVSSVDEQILEESMEKEDPHWVLTQELGHMQGLDIDGLDIEDHPGFKFRSRKKFNFTPANPGDHIQVGDFNFEVVDLSGHTPGMVGLYDKEKSTLFCGDHILGKITPNIQFWNYEVGDSLGTYLKNLEKVRDLNIKHLYSSHRFLIDDVAERVEELKAHHQKRLDEAVNAMTKKDCTVRDITKSLQWDISAKNWDEFPKSQKWFAAGEAHAHVEHLRALGICDFYKDDDGVLYYYLTDKK